MKKHLALYLVAVLVIACLAGCAGSGEGAGSDATSPASPAAAELASSEGGGKIGLVQINNTNSYYIGASQAFHEAADAFGYQLDEQFAENSLEEGIAIIENFIELGYDMIIADPQDAEALEDVFQRGKDAGIIMVSLRSPMANADYNCLISHYDGFYGVAHATFEVLGGEGKVLLLQGQIGHEASDSRTEAFYDVQKKYPGIELLDTQPCDWDPNKAVNVVDSWLVQYGEIDAILCETDGATPAVVNAVQNAGRMDEIFIAGNDGEIECLEYMTEGLVGAEAFFSSMRDGYHCMVYADAILRGQNVEKTVYLPLYTAVNKDLQTEQLSTILTDAGLSICTPEEAIEMWSEYMNEFTGMYG